MQNLEQQKDLLARIQRVLPDVRVSWDHGCSQRWIVLDKPIFTSEAVNKDFDEISFGGLGCCHERDGNPMLARAIKVVEGQRVRGTEKTCIGRYDDDHDGIDPERGWKERIRKTNGERAIPAVQKYLDDHPHVEKPDDDDDDDDE